MPRGDVFQLFLVAMFLVVYLVAFALFAGIAALAKTSWRMAGSIGIVMAMAVVMLNAPRDALPMALVAAMALLAVVGLTAVWDMKP